MADYATIKEAIRARALAEGFSAAGFAAPQAGPRPEQLSAFLREGMHGDMDWLTNRAEQRADPATLWPGVKTVLSLALNYGPECDPLEQLHDKTRGAISVYAQGRDYHDVVKKKLKALGGWIAREFGIELKVFVDTAPVMEKPLAQAAGIGWQGKHTNLVSRQFGSWLFLGEIYLALELPPDPAETDHCGACHACLDICPTQAFPEPYRLDPRRCISYLTIEHKGPIPHEFRKAIGNRIYGCDDCLAVCPWNKFAKQASDMALAPREELKLPLLVELAALDDAAFRARFAGTPVKRLGRDRFIRNVAIALGNSGSTETLPTLQQLLGDQSPLVREAASWALGELAPVRYAQMRGMRPEIDAVVVEKWGRKLPFLAVYDYGQGGVWAVIFAHAKDEITSKYPMLKIVDEHPDWMSRDEYSSIFVSNSFDIDGAPPDWLALARDERG